MSRYKVTQNEQTRWPFAKFSVTDTEGTTNGDRFVCTTDTEEKATLVAAALNFNNKPYDYGFRLVDDVDTDAQ